MNDFRTELIPEHSAWPIGLKSKILTIGSCFADEIGQRFRDNKLTVLNPFGTVYNPVSIHQLLSFGLKTEFPSQKSYLQNDGIHFNYYFHSSFSSVKKNELESKINDTIKEVNAFLKNVDRIVITYGTAFTYQLKSNSEVVGNCHKMSSANFDKRLLTVEEFTNSFQSFYSLLKSINPSAKIILTVSPVRHLKDTLELNAVSKSILRLACNSIVSQFSDAEYFPAYEILLDDLRDYRFYKTDRLHPTDEAVEYSWRKFADSYFDEPTKKFILEWKKIKKDLTHKPFHSESESHQRFLQTLLQKLEIMNAQSDVSSEIAEVKSKIILHKLQS